MHLALSQSAATLRESARGCCTIEDAGDARRVADMLGIPFYVWDMAERFKRDVMEDFVAEYSAGRTPNPCLRCNEKIKFSALLDKAVALGFDAVATGHYAQVVERPDGGRELHRAVDMAKDQSYVLGVLDADQLARAFFPLGDTTKPRDPRRGRRSAASTSRASPTPTTSASSPTATPAGGSPRGWGSSRARSSTPSSGEVVGSHQGAYAYTVGQRRGLGLDRSALDGDPRYVVQVDAAANRVMIGTADLLGVNAIRGDHARWCGPPPEGVVEVGAQVRAHGEEVPAQAWASGDDVEVRLSGRLRGVAPGQSVVLYEGTRVVGLGHHRVDLAGALSGMPRGAIRDGSPLARVRALCLALSRDRAARVARRALLVRRREEDVRDGRAGSTTTTGSRSGLAAPEGVQTAAGRGRAGALLPAALRRAPGLGRGLPRRRRHRLAARRGAGRGRLALRRPEAADGRARRR